MLIQQLGASRFSRLSRQQPRKMLNTELIETAAGGHNGAAHVHHAVRFRSRRSGAVVLPMLTPSTTAAVAAAAAADDDEKRTKKNRRRGRERK